jgi:signal transduction histidine kinase
MWATLKQRQTWKGEFINRRKDGSEYAEFAIISPLVDADGRVGHYVAVKENITEKKRVAEELDRHRRHLEELVKERTARLDETNRALARALDAAEQAASAKAAFLANMSHEIRTPLSAVLGMAHVMRRDASSVQLAQLDKIAAAGRHLQGIINDILDLSKIDADKLALVDEVFSAAALAGNVASMFTELARSKGVQLFVESDPLPDPVRGDPTRLSQILLNYLSNALKFTESGSVTLRTRLMEETAAEVLLHFEVQDTGIGVAPEAIPRLFDDFEQADNSTTRRHGGTGLGLAIARRLAALMDGSVGAESVPGAGSTFWFRARLRKAAKVGAGGTAVPHIPDAERELRRRYTGVKVLLVEDEPVNREIGCMLLEQARLHVDTAENGQRAIELFASGDYSLILMDMQMPVLGGIDATQQIRALPSGRSVPIIALTANAFDEDRDRCLAAGMNDFITKPVDPTLLYSRLLHWLANGQPHNA